MRIIFFIFFIFYFTVANSQEALLASIEKIETKPLSEKSVELANEVLELSKADNNHSLSAQAHTLLGKLTKESGDINQSIYHFSQASSIYKFIGNIKQQLKSSINEVKVLFKAKRYDDAYKLIGEILPLSQQYSDELLTAQILIIKGDGFYQQKYFNDAIAQFTNSLQYLSKSTKEIQHKRAEAYKKLAESYKRLKDRENTALFYKKALSIYENQHNNKLIARTLNTLAEAERHLGNYVISLDYSMRSLEHHEQLNDPLGYAKASMGAGIIYRHIGRYEKSLKYTHKAYLYYKKMNNSNGIAKASNQTGLIYTRLKQFDYAKTFYQRTINLPVDEVESKELATALREMAVINLNTGDYDLAMIMAKKAHNIYKADNDKLKSSLTARITGNIYRAQNNNINATRYYRESLSIAHEIGSELYQIKAETTLGSILIDENVDEAVELLKTALKLSIKINTKELTLYVYRELRKAEKHRGNVAQSLDYAEKEIALSRVIQQEEQDNGFILEKAKLHSHKLEMELELLREKNELDQLALTKKNSEVEIAEKTRLISELKLVKNRYASIALVALLATCVIVAIFIYRKFIDSTKRNRELGYLAARDPLTNCYNRRVLFDFMDRDFLSLKELGEYSIILADIDHFKTVNDTHGHIAGDTVLISVAAILQNNINESDIVARFGGEEFCIILPGSTKDQAASIAESIRQELESTSFDNTAITCSFGVSSIEFNAKTPTELIEQADLALFKSKSSGRNRVTVWQKKLEQD
ncbi:diguanylate cyclase [Pseudoalteromonas fuliginea]|uniref:diguanylate cyclase n=1 Tax=Pseudoalteromonas fuliginea TaxID=1872678 RepID=A0AB73BIJ3_9GAMM|nr:tetratricopeptide repeat-containing diguanylate cyclase [Pseudoalteromonas fuliginea]KAA1162060.1 diguanylate cyclase [Pseudoalteromonas fuliginea]